MKNYAEKSKEWEGYNTSYTFYLPYKALVTNNNVISEKDNENQIIDDSSWPHYGYDEAGSRICGRIYQNNNFSKGGHTVLCMDYGRFWIRACMNCHKIYNHKKQVWSALGPYKLYILQCDFLEMVCGSISRKMELFHEKPTMTVDNYFITDDILDWAGNKSLGIIGTNVRNRLQKTCSSPRRTFFYTRSHLSALQNCALLFSINF